MINIKKIVFNYGEKTVLKDLSLDMKESNIYGLLGENGVGKTTLLSLLCGLKKPAAGSIEIDGINPYDRQPSFLSDIYYLSDEMPEIKQSAISFGLQYGKFWNNYDHTKFIDIMKLFEVDCIQKMDTMSAGQVKKTHISFALACNTKYLLMDEPTNGLDIPSKAQFRKAITKYTQEESTIIISTHQVRDLENIIDPIIVLDDQEIMFCASVQEITEKLFFNYSTDTPEDSLYTEHTPSGSISVQINSTGKDSKFNIEALFNAAHKNKELFKTIFKK